MSCFVWSLIFWIDFFFSIPPPQDVSTSRICSRETSSVSSPPLTAHRLIDPPDMASSPSLDSDPLPLLQLQEVDSSKATERPSSPSLLPAVYSPPRGMDSHTVYIPSPYTDNNHEYNHGGGGGPVGFYSPSVLSYARPSATDSPSSLCGPLSPSAFWPPHSHSNLPSLTLRCPQPLGYNEPGLHAPWIESKSHSIIGSR